MQFFLVKIQQPLSQKSYSTLRNCQSSTISAIPICVEKTIRIPRLSGLDFFEVCDLLLVVDFKWKGGFFVLKERLVG
jgi:hypothetical protein